MTWRDDAITIIGEVHAALPADADIKARKRALNAACPHEFRSTSWGRKVWGKASRAYLDRYGLEPLAARPLPPMLSPLERAAATVEREARVAAFDAEIARIKSEIDRGWTR